MSDLIERYEAIGALYECTPFDPKGIALLDKCEGMIRAIPSADAVEVVRCKFCKHRDFRWLMNICTKHGGMKIHDDFYCGDGEHDEFYKEHVLKETDHE